MTSQYQYDDSMSDFSNAVFSVLGDWQAGNESALTSQDTEFMKKEMTKAEARSEIQKMGPQERAQLLADMGQEAIMNIMMPGGKNRGSRNT
jgi:hypothetical protein